jgi:hypothetical protein
MRPVGRFRRIALIAGPAGAIIAAGCGGSAAPKGPTVRLPSYLAQYPPQRPIAVYFLQWERRGKEVDGTLSFVFPTRADTPTRTQPVTGKVDEDTISLEVGADPPRKWEGTRVGRRIVFEAHLGDADIEKIRFVPASLAAFRKTVAKVRAGR